MQDFRPHHVHGSFESKLADHVLEEIDAIEKKTLKELSIATGRSDSLLQTVAACLYLHHPGFYGKFLLEVTRIWRTRRKPDPIMASYSLRDSCTSYRSPEYSKLPSHVRSTTTRHCCSNEYLVVFP